MTSIVPVSHLALAVKSMRERNLLDLAPSLSSSSTDSSFACPSLSLSSSTSSSTATENETPPLSPIIEEESGWPAKLSTPTVNTPRVHVFEPDLNTDVPTPRIDRYTATDDAGYEAENEESAEYKGAKSSIKRMRMDRPRRSATRSRQQPAHIDLSSLPQALMEPRAPKRYIGLGLGLPCANDLNTSSISEAEEHSFSEATHVAPSCSPANTLMEPRVPRRPIGLGLGLPSVCSTSTLEIPPCERSGLPLSEPIEVQAPFCHLASGPYPPLSDHPLDEQLQLREAVLLNSFSQADSSPHLLISPDLLRPADESADHGHALIRDRRASAYSSVSAQNLCETGSTSTGTFPTLTDSASYSAFPRPTGQLSQLCATILPESFSPMELLPSPLVPGNQAALPMDLVSMHSRIPESHTVRLTSMDTFGIATSLAAHDNQGPLHPRILPGMFSPVSALPSPVISGNAFALDPEASYFPPFAQDLWSLSPNSFAARRRLVAHDSGRFETPVFSPIPSPMMSTSVACQDLFALANETARSPIRAAGTMTAGPPSVEEFMTPMDYSVRDQLFHGPSFFSAHSASYPSQITRSCPLPSGSIPLLPCSGDQMFNMCPTFSPDFPPMNAYPSPFAPSSPSSPSRGTDGFSFPTLSMNASGPMYVGAFLTIANLAYHNSRYSDPDFGSTRSEVPADVPSSSTFLDSSYLSPGFAEVAGTPAVLANAREPATDERSDLTTDLGQDAMNGGFNLYFSSA